MHRIPLNLIDPNPWQTRQVEPDPAYIKELALDIASKGLLQAPMGRLVDPSGQPIAFKDNITHWDALQAWHPGARVQLAFGHNRLAAFRYLAAEAMHETTTTLWVEMPVELRPLTNEQLADFAWSENEQRRDVDPLSRALAVQRRLSDFGWTHEQAGAHLGLSRPTITNLLRVLTLPAEIQQALGAGQISMRQADALLSLYALPEEIRKKGQVQWDDELKPSAIARDALNGEATSDAVRARTKRLIERFSQTLNSAPWALSQAFDYPGSYSSTCEGCTALAVNGNWKYCLVPDCFRLRTAVYQRQYLEEAAQASGFPVVEEGKERYDVYDFSGWRDEAEHIQAILKRPERCPNLCLAWTDRKDGAHPDQFPHAAIVCRKRKQFCTCENGLVAAADLARRAQAQPPAPSNNGDRPAQPEAPAGKPLSQVFEYETLAGGLQVALMLSVDGATWLRLARKNVYPSDQEWATVLAHFPYDPPADAEPDRYEASDGLLCLRSSWSTPESTDVRE